MVELKTQRLVLNELVEDDAQTILKAFTNPNIQKGLVNVPPNFNYNMAIGMVETQEYCRMNMIQHLFAVRLGDDMVGCVSLHAFNGNEVEIGYWILEEHWGNGFATESTKAVIEYALNELKMTKIKGAFAKDNEASKKVLSKVGMEEEAVLSTSILYSLIYSKC